MSINVQAQIRNNATDIRSYLSDLYKWEDEVNGTSAPKAQPKKKKEYEIRGDVRQSDPNPSSNTKATPKELQRDINSIPNYYKAWDAYNPVPKPYFP